MRTLDELRREIDEVDRGIKELYLRRMSAVNEVAAYKMATGDAVYNPEREKQVLEAKADTYGLPDVYRTVMRRSREYQYCQMIEQGAVTLPYVFADDMTVKTVYFQGIDGSYSSVAAKTLYPNANHVSVAAFSDVAQKVMEDESAAGILPIDNSTEGSVNATYDLMLRHDIYITKAITLDIRHCLAGCPGASMETVRTITSHPQALAQCRRLTDRYVTVPASNTAVAARDVADMGDPTVAAICSKEAAALYGLKILAEDIQDSSANATRFACLSKCLQKTGNTISLVLHLDHVVGSLAGLLPMFADYGVSLTKIQSRPIPDKRWEYCFYLDFDGSYDDPKVRALLFQLESELPFVKLLGVYEHV